MSELKAVLRSLYLEYKNQTTSQLKLLDFFFIFSLIVALVQFAYMIVFGTFPFNSFLSGFFTAIGEAIFTVSLRMQLKRDNTAVRPIGDFIFCNLVLFLAAFNFMG
eukprot:TRINITY_DN56_c0_g1_i1.p1 TRINITY_DN56_c0_g1~~TRINITY_DN56_c0_g1_i1.p1  ORF type:complete len:106 (+),score=31.97 TRINITY_DN56_c0_g1_i1:67-384(+)